MKFNTFTLILSFVLLCTLIILTGCDEQQQVHRERLAPEWFDQPVWDQIRSGSTRNSDLYNQRSALKQTNSSAPNNRDTDAQFNNTNVVQNNYVSNNVAPRIQFSNNKLSHDFGKVSPNSIDSICEFVFKNTGNSNLVITDLKTSCDCTPAILDGNKTEYAPGESGRILAGYTDTLLGQNIKHIYVSTNDPENSRIELAIIADVVAPVDYEPKKLNLSLLSNNADVEDIVIRSLDNKPFSITGFESVGNCITVNFNPNEKATQFILKPKVDTEVLRMLPEGKFNIRLSHPDCPLVSGSYYAPARFTISPQRLTLNNINPGNSIVRTITIKSNYGEQFDLETSLSNQSVLNIVNYQKITDGYRLSVEINPPPSRNGAQMFSESINLALPGFESFTVQCNGYYPGANVSVQNQEEECKTCGPVRVDRPSMSLRPR